MSNIYATSTNPLWAWWRERAITTVEHDAIVQRIAGEAGWSSRYAFMVVIAAGISILGLLLPSSAVLIGAMLISPLMMPIIGLGFSLATFDFYEMRRAGLALAAGSLIAILLSAIFVSLSPLQTVTNEIAIRTQPNLFDLLVAVLSSLAGSYALIRGRGETVVGVAIAIALMPPLAVVGFGLAMKNWTIAGGAFLLFMTNFVAIALTAAFMARLYGFGSHLSPAHTRLQSILVIVGMTALAVPLALTLRQIAWETLAQRQIRDAIQRQFPSTARISDLETDFRSHPMKVVATVFTAEYTTDADKKVRESLDERLRRDLDVNIDQVRVGTGNAETAQVAAAQARDRAQALNRSASLAADRLALVAGVTREDVTVDQGNRRATAVAKPMAGAGLDLYRELERRATIDIPDWTLALIPPPAPLPAISFSGDEPDEAGTRNLDLAGWAGRRQALTIVVAGRNGRAEAVRDALVLRQVPADRLVIESAANTDVRLSWRLPE
ncbi:DUF389 domain-containing protein [Sphingobium lignivorans]|uniref:Hydrophobic protein (TIGR00271 family) n=1 Tax=Sphingobium lignivorans TaxID=2735886 RepID=A0ABR6NEF3_9SPHN|nr:DUF389 domain-containing protein [Sphingobium lignivorans]MBB5985667.1 putative hydrophobic protein (TIGR00271 family) [Sphingobium lignivorans]